MNKTYAFLATLVIIAVSAIVITALVATNKSNNQDRFSVTGSGIVYSKADIAKLQVGIKTGAKVTAVDATREATARMNDIVGELKRLGIEEKDIKTTEYNLSPVFVTTKAEGRKLSGYEVVQNMAVKIRDLSKIADVITGATQKGANLMDNIQFTIDDEYALKNKAREMAIQKAKEKAELIAKQSGMNLGRVVSVNENQSGWGRSYSNSVNESYTMNTKDAVAGQSIESGQNEVRVEVTLVYEVK